MTHLQIGAADESFAREAWVVASPTAARIDIRFSGWEGFNDGCKAAITPRGSRPCGRKPSREVTEQRGVAARAWQPDTNAGGSFYNARGDLDEP
jgi:hypothetical protein